MNRAQKREREATSAEPRRTAMRASRGAKASIYGFTLIETIGVLAVIAILAAVLLPALIRQLDKAVADRESATLQAMGAALQQYVVTTRTIPDQTTWSSALASKMGISTNDVLYNPHQQSHQQPRVFLIDRALQIGALRNGLPYLQTDFVTNSGGPMPPVSPRIMIVSSLGRPLPAAVTSGLFATNYFSDLWNAADGTVPADTAWAGWVGDPGDIKVQRIHLGPLFVHLLLINYMSSPLGAYTIDGVDNVTLPTTVGTPSGVDGYFIQGSVLTLYTDSTVGTMDAKQILTRDASYVFEQQVWRGSLIGAALSIGDIGDVVNAFMNATPNQNDAVNQHAANPNSKAQQVQIVRDMISYMSNYNAWASSGFTTGSGGQTKSTLGGNQGIMMLDIGGIYAQSLNGNNYSPVNTNACQ